MRRIRTQIKLHGELGKRFQRTFVAAISSAAEAVRALDSQLEGFSKWIREASDRGIVFKVRIGKEFSFWDLDAEGLDFSVPEGFTIHIIPVPGGSGRIGKIILGVALLGLGIAGIGFLGMSPLMTAVTGGLLLISGLIGGKTPPPNPNEDRQQSFIFSGATNTTTVGGRVPVLYGVMQVGSTVISAAVVVSVPATGDYQSGASPSSVRPAFLS